MMKKDPRKILLQLTESQLIENINETVEKIKVMKKTKAYAFPSTISAQVTRRWPV
ncbi:MAG: hypothetical protein ACU84J_04750 [Gammaproteobacteria bacterium]